MAGALAGVLGADFVAALGVAFGVALGAALGATDALDAVEAFLAGVAAFSTGFLATAAFFATAFLATVLVAFCATGLAAAGALVVSTGLAATFLTAFLAVTFFAAFLAVAMVKLLFIIRDSKNAARDGLIIDVERPFG